MPSRATFYGFVVVGGEDWCDPVTPKWITLNSALKIDLFAYYMSEDFVLVFVQDE